MNNILEKIKAENVLTIAGRPCMGKTVVGLNIAVSLAETKKVLYVYTESKLPFESSEFKFDFINVSTISDIMCAILKNEYDVVIIDSFLYMRNHKIEDTAYMLKTIAQELDVAVVVQTHIPRKCDLRNDKRPKYSDIKYKKMCGYLYKYSDRIVFLYRDYCYYPEKDDIMEIVECDKGLFGERHIIERIPFRLLMDAVYIPSEK
ncbi:MAG: hypothetical protein K5768_05075 [Firmicutes bacterium]|nr:hypothetical protein [Bacillota bacterium]